MPSFASVCAGGTTAPFLLRIRAQCPINLDSIKVAHFGGQCNGPAPHTDPLRFQIDFRVSCRNPGGIERGFHWRPFFQLDFDHFLGPGQGVNHLDDDFHRLP